MVELLVGAVSEYYLKIAPGTSPLGEKGFLLAFRSSREGLPVFRVFIGPVEGRLLAAELLKPSLDDERTSDEPGTG